VGRFLRAARARAARLGRGAARHGRRVAVRDLRRGRGPRAGGAEEPPRSRQPPPPRARAPLPPPGPGGVGASDGAVHQQVDDEVDEVVSRELRRRGRGRTRVPEAEAALVGALDVARELGRDLCANQICNPNSM